MSIGGDRSPRPSWSSIPPQSATTRRRPTASARAPASGSRSAGWRCRRGGPAGRRPPARRSPAPRSRQRRRSAELVALVRHRPLGRDLLSRVVFGARVSLLVATVQRGRRRHDRQPPRLRRRLPGRSAVGRDHGRARHHAGVPGPGAGPRPHHVPRRQLDQRDHRHLVRGDPGVRPPRPRPDADLRVSASSWSRRARHRGTARADPAGRDRPQRDRRRSSPSRCCSPRWPSSSREG